MLRSVLIFPQLNDRFTINRIRQRYDDLYEHIAPHISLVFPFDNELTDETIIQVVTDIIKKQQQFKLRLTATITEVAIEHILENSDSAVFTTICLGERDEN